MKGMVLCLVMVMLSVSVSNTQKQIRPFNPENKMVIVTLDGFRWQEVFRGADSILINDTDITADTAFARAMYWDATAMGRRKKLMPFLWSVVAKEGQLFGNRDYGNQVNVSNPYSLSYPGYSELLTGSVDYSIYGNDKLKNPNRNILEKLNQSEAYRGKVAAFTSWEMFPYILDRNEKTSFVLNSGLQKVEGKNLSTAQALINNIQKEIDPESETRYDELTFIACKEYVLRNKPSVLFLSFSGTDNAGHENKYGQYLQQANNADRMIGELWRLLQALPEYKGHTTLLITTDHGRGQTTGNWKKHGFFVPGSSQTWYALIGNTVVPHGEMKMKTQVYQKELNTLIGDILTRDGTADTAKPH